MSSRFPLSYGGIYNGGGAIAVTISDTGVFYTIPATWTAGQMRNASMTNDYGLTVTYAGIYLVNFYLCPYIAASNQDLYAQVYAAGNAQANSLIQFRCPSTNITFNASGTCILSLAAGDELTLRVRNSTSTTQVNIRYCNLNAERIG